MNDKSNKIIVIILCILLIICLFALIKDLYMPSFDSFLEFKEKSKITSYKGTLLVNINFADLKELQTLPNIGPMIAQKIIDYRNYNGSFSKIEDIMNVPGIGKKTFEDLKDQITV